MQQPSEYLTSGSSLGHLSAECHQFSTFTVDQHLYGIDVIRVQEVVRSMPMTPIPLAPPFVRGLINLRGQVTTAIGIRELFEIPSAPPEHSINVVCRIDGILLSLQVDEIGDVIEVPKSEFEHTPQTVPHTFRKFMEGVYKVPNSLLSVISIDKIYAFLNKQTLE
jgi:purine-binding chemotaxis protein CheW